MKKLLEKNLSFLDQVPFMHGGVFDNKKIYENTLVAYNSAIKNNIGIKTDIRLTLDHQLICFADENEMRMLHTEDKVNDDTYENIIYIAKYPILKLHDVLEIVDGKTPLLFEVFGIYKSSYYENSIMEELANYKGPYAIESNDLGLVKWFYKNHKDVVIGYKVDKVNDHKFHFFYNYDFIDIDVELSKDKDIRKGRECSFILGHNVFNDFEYENKITVYNNLVCETKLENDL